MDAANRGAARLDVLDEMGPTDPQTGIRGMALVDLVARDLRAAITRYRSSAHPCVVEGMEDSLRGIPAIKNTFRALSEGRFLDAVAGVELFEETAKKHKATAAACKAEVGYKGRDDPGYDPR